jgi:3-oxoacyl-[acyl-carrier-protein] synthase II
MSASMRKAVVTGMGVVCPLGNDVESSWQGLLSGRSGVSFITEFPTADLRSDIAASVSGFDALRYLSRKETDIYGRVTQLSLAAAVWPASAVS